jgi:hypothetical protein
MADLSMTVALVLILALILVAFFAWVMRGGRLRKFDVQLHKLFRFRGEADTQGPGALHVVDVQADDDAHGILKWLQERFDRIDGSYILTESTGENTKVAAQLYTKLTGTVIGTCFFGSPDYGPSDFASTISPNVRLTRLTRNIWRHVTICSRARQSAK